MINFSNVNITQGPTGTPVVTSYKDIAWPVPVVPNCDYPCNTTNAVTSPGIICQPSEGWNCNLCGNDSPYYNPVAAGDTLYFQLQIQNTKNAPAGVKFKAPGANYFSLPYVPKIKYGWYHHADNSTLFTIRAQIFDACTEEEFKVSGHNYLDDIIDQAVVFLAQDLTASAKLLPTNAQYKWVQNLQITLPSTLPVGFPELFYIKFTITDYSSATSELYTEPYKVVNCENTILIEGKYNREDCIHQTYQSAATHTPTLDMTPLPYVLDSAYLYPSRNYSGAFRNIVRIPGYCVESGVNITKEVPERSCEATKTTRQQLYRLRSRQLPPYVAQKVINALAGITGYLTTDKLGTIQVPTSANPAKNNDKSYMWLLDIELQGCVCSDWHQC